MDKYELDGPIFWKKRSVSGMCPFSFIQTQALEVWYMLKKNEKLLLISLGFMYRWSVLTRGWTQNICIEPFLLNPWATGISIEVHLLSHRFAVSSRIFSCKTIRHLLKNSQILRKPLFLYLLYIKWKIQATRNIKQFLQHAVQSGCSDEADAT